MPRPALPVVGRAEITLVNPYVPTYFTLPYLVWLVSIGLIEAKHVHPNDAHVAVRVPGQVLRLSRPPALYRDSVFVDPQPQNMGTAIEAVMGDLTGCTLEYDHYRISRTRHSLYSLDRGVAENWKDYPGDTWVRSNMRRATHLALRAKNAPP